MSQKQYWDLCVGISADSEQKLVDFMLRVSEIVNDVAPRFGVSVSVGGIQKVASSDDR